MGICRVDGLHTSVVGNRVPGEGKGDLPCSRQGSSDEKGQITRERSPAKRFGRHREESPYGWCGRSLGGDSRVIARRRTDPPQLYTASVPLRLFSAGILCTIESSTSTRASPSRQLAVAGYGACRDSSRLICHRRNGTRGESKGCERKGACSQCLSDLWHPALIALLRSPLNNGPSTLSSVAHPPGAPPPQNQSPQAREGLNEALGRQNRLTAISPPTRGGKGVCRSVVWCAWTKTAQQH